jgi:hypothetical protein
LPPPALQPALPLVQAASQVALPAWAGPPQVAWEAGPPQVAWEAGPPQLASQDGLPAEGAPNADLPAAKAINISPSAKFVFLLAVMFPSCLGLPLRQCPKKRANR